MFDMYSLLINIYFIITNGCALRDSINGPINKILAITAFIKGHCLFYWQKYYFYYEKIFHIDFTKLKFFFYD